MLAGLLVAFLPFLGFPNAWDQWILLGLGVAIIALGVAVRRSRRRAPLQVATQHEETH